MKLFWVGCVFLADALAVTMGWTADLDTKILELVHRTSSPALDLFWLKLNFFGGPQFLLPVGAASIVGALILKRWREAGFLTVAIGISSSLDWGLRALFKRQRPSLWPSLIPDHTFVYSFPSGHATLATAVAGCFAILFWPLGHHRPIALIALTYLLAIALSSLYLGVHYPSDLLGGWSLSGACCLASYRVWLENSATPSTTKTPTDVPLQA